MNYQEIFEYKDGKLYWKARNSNRVKVGDRAGRAELGRYRQIQLNGNKLYEHRIIYEMHYGPVPEGMEIDHIDRNKENNLIENLRAVTQSENQWNRGASGFTYLKGKGKFQAQIQVGDKRKYLGLYETPVDAHIAYLKAKEKYHVSKTRENVL